MRHGFPRAACLKTLTNASHPRQEGEIEVFPPSNASLGDFMGPLHARVKPGAPRQLLTRFGTMYPSFRHMRAAVLLGERPNALRRAWLRAGLQLEDGPQHLEEQPDCCFVMPQGRAALGEWIRRNSQAHQLRVAF